MHLSLTLNRTIESAQIGTFYQKGANCNNVRSIINFCQFSIVKCHAQLLLSEDFWESLYMDSISSLSC